MVLRYHPYCVTKSEKGVSERGLVLRKLAKPITTHDMIQPRRDFLVLGVAAAFGAWLTPTVQTSMSQFSFNSDGSLDINPSKTSTQTDFDFFVGRWRIDNRKLKTRLSHCTEWLEFPATSECHKILNGFGNTDQFITEFNGVPFQGATFRLFNPQTRLWSIYWADSNAVVLDVPQVGSFQGDIGKFYAKDIFQGIPILVIFQWDKTDPESPVWSQAFSTDKGKTWEWNWYMTFHKQK